MINLFFTAFKKVFFTVLMLTVSTPLFLFCQNPAENQNPKKTESKAENDSIQKPVHDPHKASIYSIILPGLGQAYNKKYWKIPIIYAGFGVFYYFIDFNNTEYKAWREAYYHAINGDASEPPVNEYEEMYGDRPDVLKDQKDYYRRNRDLTYILSGIWYLLNVVDATVDAHLFSWEVDDQLSLRVEPSLTYPAYGFQPAGGGIRLTLNFR